ncbi:hypothetical protein BsWGS_23399 [Bradybaena similaris]
MEAAKRILITLASVLVAADCLFLFAKRDEIIRELTESLSDCEERLIPCWDVLNMQPDNRNIYNLRIMIDTIDEVCTTHQLVADCMRPVLNECAIDYRPLLDAFLSAEDYRCSQEGRSVLSETSGSPCYSDHQRFHDIQQLTNSCMNSSSECQGEFNDCACQDELWRQHCEEQAAIQQCGKVYGTYVREIYNRSNAALQCSANS